jgi:UV DNA damage endonuclease
MLVRFGYVAMSVVVENASPSRTMTAATFVKIADREAALNKIIRLAEENLHNTLRLLRHNRAHHIHVFRFSSKLIPLLGHELLGDWDPFELLKQPFEAIGEYVKLHDMRVSFHPDHFTVLSTPRADVLQKSYDDLDRHVRMLDDMGLDERAKCNIHIGGAYKDKSTSMTRFIEQFSRLSERIQRRLTLENDDKTYNAIETLEACERLNVPMVLDIHHQAVNNQGETAASLWPRILKTWAAENVPPKIHASSPKSETDRRSHADYLYTPDLLTFLVNIAEWTSAVDVMIEAKMKDGALFRLMEELRSSKHVEIVDDATIRILR